MSDNNGNGSRIRGAIDNVWALVVARFVLPLLVVVVGSIGTIALNSLVTNSQSVWVKLTEMHEDLAGIHIYLREFTATRDHELAQVNSKLAEQDQRLRDIEGQLGRRH